ncbi:deoxyribonuclease IV [Dysgonomonas capnocytophagoides]|uniref:Probable endonuclease 4 n=1 Tax=Dysgonomonas capnocytophagoides TaxID=45254 RepID=A0A4Y8KZG7_9BACT|nr:deoxyribonuclease IV [Dysgonomonas capnocytophagoides]TFD93103.1 deoxyribonuclease IV [Dysgonomonas capnocytophagoides]
MLNIGCHLSLSKGYEAMGKDALKIGANTFQFFTRNPRGGSAKEIDPKDADALAVLVKTNNFAPLLAHAPYTMNLCSAKPETRQFAKEMMADDLARMEILPCHLYNFHPGSYTTQGIDVAMGQIIDALNEVIKPDQTTIVLLETMAGKGSEVGRTFEELRQIIDGVKLQDKMGVCLDTCHVYDAGYDIVNDLDGVINHFDKVVGLDRLKAIHLNDSMNPMNSHKDRHQKIGEGSLGLETFRKVINHPKLRHLPFNLETPNELDGYQKEIELLRSEYVETVAQLV